MSGSLERSGALRWRVRRLVVAGVLLGGLLSWADGNGTPASEPPARAAEPTLPALPPRDFSAESSFEVLDVRAGNVLVVQLAGEQRIVRLLGTYVPLAGSESDAARPFTQRLLQGERVFLVYEPDWPLLDREERYWAYVYRAPDGLLVNLELLRLGYARLSAAAPFEHQALFRTYEAHARRHRKGLWAPPPEEPTSQPAPPPPAAQPPTVAPAGGGATADAARIEVLVTRSGRKYHRPECRYVKTGGVRMTLKEAREQGYAPCSACNPPV
ncbi:MAG: thermonuclease family protein [Phycisphaerales bacterium]|nr:thermonuclease family protein [Phycisphaerales bacterium]